MYKDQLKLVQKILFSSNRLKYIKAIVFLFCLLPLLNLVFAILQNPLSLGANPAEYIIRKLGEWSMYFILIGLSITPLRHITGLNVLIKFRRMIGLFAFFYVSVHFLAYLGFDRVFLWGEIIDDVIKRPFIAVGFIAFLCLVPLAVTSTRGWVLRMGGKNWVNLHRLVYLIAILGVIHYWWLVKRDLTWPIAYAVILGLLFILRHEKVKRIVKL